jgi:hypothetical protein
MQTSHQTPKQPRKNKFILFIAIALSTMALAIGVKVAMADFSRYPDAPPTAEQQTLEQRQQMTEEELGATCQVEGATGLSLVSSTNNESSAYQVWRMTIDGVEIQRTTSLFGTVCGLVNDSRYMQTPYEDVPEDVVRNLSIGILEYNIKLLGGLEAYQAGLIETLKEAQSEPDVVSKFSEIDVEAWNVLGVQIPAELYEVIEYVPAEPFDG